MKVTPTELAEVLVIEPRVHGDARGFFVETYQRDRYRAAGMPDFVQDNLSRSARGVLRGLHYQHPTGQGKLVTVLEGEVFDVAVDVRPDSPTFGRWVGVVLSAENKLQIWVPVGFAHGFLVTSESALFAYKVTAFYDPAAEGAVLWSDPDLAIPWPIHAPTVSEKDARAPRLRDVPRDRLPRSADPRP